MKREDYLADPSVRDFVNWLRPVVSGDVGFKHRYRALRSDCEWQCESLWQACGAGDESPGQERGYRWNGKGFWENQSALDDIAERVHRTTAADDRHGFIDAVLEILQWGGVTRGNEETLNCLGKNALPTFVETAGLLDPSRADTQRLDQIKLMNAGWTKVYALMLDDVPIYDSRVGAATGYLVQQYCRCRQRQTVPKLLRFAWGPARLSPQRQEQHNRNPSWENLKFPRLSYGSIGSRKWAECNVWAAWVLGEVCSEGQFGKLASKHQLRAIEAALFMIGYELPRPR